MKGQNAIEIINHLIWESLKGKREFAVNVEDGLVFHYRDDYVFDMLQHQQVEDNRARVFGSFIWKSVDFVCAKVFADGICPMQEKAKNSSRFE